MPVGENILHFLETLLKVLQQKRMNPEDAASQGLTRYSESKKLNFVPLFIANHPE